MNLANFDIFRYFRIPTLGQIRCFILKYVIMPKYVIILSAETGNTRKNPMHTRLQIERRTEERSLGSPNVTERYPGDQERQQWKEDEMQIVCQLPDCSVL